MKNRKIKNIFGLIKAVINAVRKANQAEKEFKKLSTKIKTMVTYILKKDTPKSKAGERIHKTVKSGAVYGYVSESGELFDLSTVENNPKWFEPEKVGLWIKSMNVSVHKLKGCYANKNEIELTLAPYNFSFDIYKGKDGCINYNEIVNDLVNDKLEIIF